MKKFLSTLMAVLMVAMLLAGCGGGNSDAPAASGGSEAAGGDDAAAGGSGEGYDLTFWVYSDVVQGEQGKLMDQWVEEFVAENENCNSITLVAKNDSELLTSLLAGVGLPDCFFASATNGKQFRDTMDLIDLKAMYDEDPDYTASFYPEAIQAITADGGMWCVPFISYVAIMYRNLDVLEAAGIDPAEGTPTYDAFLDQMQKIQDAGVQPTHSWTAGSAYPIKSIMGSDTPNLTQGVTEDGKTTLQASELVRSYETLAKIEAYGNSMAWGDDVTLEAFKGGELGFILDGPWSEPGLIESGVNYDVVLVPAYEEGGWTGGEIGWDMMYGIASEDAEKDELVTKWLKKLGEYDSQKAWTMNVGRSTLRVDVMDDEEVTSHTMMARVTSPGLKCGLIPLDFMTTTVYWPSANADVAPRAGSGEITAEEASEEFITALNGLYAESGEF